MEQANLRHPRSGDLARVASALVASNHMPLNRHHGAWRMPCLHNSNSHNTADPGHCSKCLNKQSRAFQPSS
eukprot:1147288-Pelagomonas_calceolata.AAC.1